MDWEAYFKDLQKWMAASNVMLTRVPLDSEKYFEWAANTLDIIYNRYDHALAHRFLYCIMEYQEDMLEKSKVVVR